MDTLRLHLNELPWSPPQPVLEAARKGLGRLNRYADEQEMENLRMALGEYAEVKPERVVLSPGSAILLREAILLFAEGRKVITLCPSFLPTMRSARQSAQHLLRIRLPLPDFRLDLNLLEGELKGPSLLILDNPNNPTGRLVISPDEVERLLRKNDLLMIVDEAYFEFCGVTCAHLVEKHPNLLVTRSLDKVFCLAGTRIGYGLAGDRFQKAMSGFFAYLPQVTLLAARAALENVNVMLDRVNYIVTERERVLEQLQLAGVKAYGSAANFVLIDSPIPNVTGELRERKILVKDLGDQMPEGFIRVTIGLPEENDLFLKNYLDL